MIVELGTKRVKNIVRNLMRDAFLQIARLTNRQHKLQENNKSCKITQKQHIHFLIDPTTNTTFPQKFFAM